MDLKRTAFGLLAIWGVTSGALFSPLGAAFAGVAGVVGYLGCRRVNQAQDRSLAITLGGLGVGTAYAVGSYVEQGLKTTPPAIPVKKMKVAEEKLDRCLLASDEQGRKDTQKKLRESLGIRVKTEAEMRRDKDEYTYFHWTGPNGETYVYDISDDYKRGLVYNLNAQVRQDGRQDLSLKDIVVRYESEGWIDFTADPAFLHNLGKYPQVDIDKLAYMYTLDQFHEALAKGGIIEFSMKQDGDIDTTFYTVPIPGHHARRIKCMVENKAGCQQCNNIADVVRSAKE